MTASEAEPVDGPSAGRAVGEVQLTADQRQAVAADAVLVVEPPSLLIAADLDGNAPLTIEAQLRPCRERAIGLAQERASQVLDPAVQTLGDLFKGRRMGGRCRGDRPDIIQINQGSPALSRRE